MRVDLLVVDCKGRLVGGGLRPLFFAPRVLFFLFM